MFDFTDVSKKFGAVRAVGPLAFSLAAGKTTALIGPSGCGKSTLLRLMIGLIRPDSGTVLFDGAPLDPEKIQTIRRRMGYVIQEGGLFPHMTARRNIGLMAGWLGWGDKKLADRTRELCTLTRFPPEGLDRYPSELSGGQRQRVALMRALMLDPDVLLLDEPLGALDPMIRHGLQTELREIFRSLKKTVVLVTHDIGEAAWFGDRIILLRDGVIVQDGAIDAFLNHPAEPFVEQFITARRDITGGPDR
jgi:osmoprotectant transport system ATP-binding protein